MFSISRAAGSHRASRTTRSTRRVVTAATTLAVACGSVVAIGLGTPADASDSVIARDDFSRRGTTGWGAAPVGGPWSSASSRGLSVGAGQGIIDLARAGESRDLALPRASASEVTLSTSAQILTVPESGSGVRYAARVRSDGKRSYDAVVRVIPGGNALLSLSRVEASGQRTRLSDDITLGARITPKTVLRLSVEANGSATVALNAKAELVERVTRTRTTSVPAPTSTTAAAVRRAEVAHSTASRALASAVKKRATVRKRVQKQKDERAALTRARGAVRTARAELTRAESSLRTARAAHTSMANRRITRTTTVVDDQVTATRSTTARDSTAERIATAGHVGVWAYTSTDTPRARIAVTSLKAVGRTPAATPAPVPNSAPVAAFSPTVRAKSLSASFDGSASSDQDGRIVTYAWRFGDGASGEGVSPTHAYALPGTYTVDLTVTDDRGASRTTTRQVRVTAPNVAPAAGFTSTQQALAVDLDGTTSTDPDGRIASYAWDLGDGNRAEGARVSHTYARTGSYRVVLVVTDDDGASATLDRTVVATDPPPPNEAPRAAFEASVAAKGLDVSLDATRSDDLDGEVVGYEWRLGDGSTATGPTVRHSYARAGSYTIKLTVTDNGGATSTTARTVDVREANIAPSPAFDVRAQDLKVDVDGTGSQDPDGSVVAHRWEFGDGRTGSGATYSHTYAAAGTYTVRLSVTDDDGATSSTTRVVTVKAPAPPVAAKPSAANTGVPAGVTLKRHDGDMVITRAGTVIDSMDIYGFVTVKAPDVTITRSRVRGGRATGNIGLITNYGYDNLLVEDVDLSPDQPSVWVDGLKGWDFTARRIHVVGGVDSVKIHGDNARVEDSLLENTHYFANDPNQGGGPTHNDNVQVLNGRNVHILRNTIRGATNMAIYAAPEKGAATVWANGNWVDGGHCTMKYSDKGGHGMTVFVEDNRFGPNRKVQSCVLLATPATDFRPTNNTWESNGAAVPILRKAD